MTGFVLVSHDPFDQDSPYRSASPIFLHLHPCEAVAPSGALPSQLTGRQLAVRAFDHDAMMIDAAIIDGADLANNLDRLFDNENTDRIHIHNASRGCWAVTAERA